MQYHIQDSTTEYKLYLWSKLTNTSVLCLEERSVYYTQEQNSNILIQLCSSPYFKWYDPNVSYIYDPN